METIGLILFYGGMIVSVIAGIWFLVVAFQESVLWGLGCLLVPFVSLFFLIIHWKEAKRPFLWTLLAVIPIVIGIILGAKHRPLSY